MSKFKCYFNYFDEEYKITDENGFIWGSGTTVDEAIDDAETWLQTTTIKKLEFEE